ncbi:MAG: hypothetical protein PHQ98_04770 [Candidatus ainarchaeum sp.]|nr:hypothetical protein [Candidatus ainarchaeum sp.]
MRKHITRIVTSIRRSTTPKQTTPTQKVAIQQYLPGFEPTTDKSKKLASARSKSTLIRPANLNLTPIEVASINCIKSYFKILPKTSAERQKYINRLMSQMENNQRNIINLSRSSNVSEARDLEEDNKTIHETINFLKRLNLK